MPTLYPGALAPVPTSFASVDAMWLSFQTMATNKPPAINGDYFSLPLSAGSSLQAHARNRSQSRSATLSSHSGHVGSSINPVVMSVAYADNNKLGPFSFACNHWPANPSHWDTVGQVSDSFNNTNDRTLWTSPLTPDARAQSFRDNKGRCLNCHGTYHSFKTCAQRFLNWSGCLIPSSVSSATTVTPAVVGNSVCAPTVSEATLTVVGIPPDNMTTTVTAIISEATHTSLREKNSGNNGQGHCNYGSASDTGSNAPLLLG